MTKKEVAQAISDIMDLPQRQTLEMLQSALDAIVDQLAMTGHVELRNFGTFKVKMMPARNLKHPQNGQSIVVPERIKIVFKPGKVMEAKVNQYAQRRSQFEK